MHPLALDVAELVYSRATSAQIRKHFENNSQVWAGRLAMRDYIHIQYHLSQLEVSKDTSAYWVLYPKGKPLDIVCSCSTHERDVIVNAGEGAHQGRAVVITDIYTVPQHRRRHLATYLLQKVAETLDARSNPVLFSVIFSSAYTEMHLKTGWDAVVASNLRITLGDVKIERPELGNGVQYYRFNNMEFSTHRDIAMSKTRLSGHRDGKTYVQFLCSLNIAKWHIIRSKMYARSLGKEVPSVYGAVYKDPDTPRRAWMLWAHDFSTNTLNIFRFVALRTSGMEDGIAKLIEVAMAEASRWGLHEVVMWEPTEQVIKGAEIALKSLDDLGEGICGINMHVERRGDNIPSLRWHKGEKREMQWRECQLYTWC